MPTLLYSLSLLAGLGCFGWELRAKFDGWEFLPYLTVFLSVCLPLTGLPTVAIVATAGLRNSWPWTFTAGILLLAASLQFTLFVLWNQHRWSFCFTAVLLIGLSVAGLVRGSAPLKLPSGFAHEGPLLLALGCALVAGVYAQIAHARQQDLARAERFRVEEAHDDETLRGIERAAWLLSQEFWNPEGFDRTRFVREGDYRGPREHGDYRWDSAQQRLIVTRIVFGDTSGFRPRVAPIAERALASQALRTGPRPDLGGGVLSCSPPLNCNLVWGIDVENAHGGQRALRGKTGEWVNTLEVSVVKELFPGAK